MASSDDEGEAVPHTASNYHFVDDKNVPVSFSELPVQWNDVEGQDGTRKQLFLHGTTDNGLQKIYKQVKAWKFDLSDAKPQIWVLSKESYWINLQKPRKSFEDTIRTILITVHCLHALKKNPELSGRSLWDHLSKVFSSYETRPSENDLIDHANIISGAVGKDETLAKSKFLVTFLEEKPRKKKALDEDFGTATKLNFIVDDDMIDDFEEDEGSDEEDDLFDSVCAICDNGGDILCCEGRCMRSFHATVEAGSDSACESLGLTNEQVDAIQNFFCKNCQYKKHQCFSCGELGSSDKSSGAEVFPCVSATCGRFYHPHCVAKLLHRDSAAKAEELQKQIAAGESFTCPIHKCIVCKQGENKMDPGLQFAVCRRCPKSYHRKCLPRKIAFEDLEDEGIIQRAWKDLIPDRILIYCLKHEIDDELGTPMRNHIKFPDDGQKKKKQISEQLPRKVKVVQKERTLDSADALRKSTLGKLQKGVDSSIKAEDGSLKKSESRLTGPNLSMKQKVGDTSIKTLKKSASTKGINSTNENRVSLGAKLYNLMSKSVSIKSRKDDASDSEHKQILTDKPVAKEKSGSLDLDDDSKQRILALVKEAGSSITLEKVIQNHKLPKTHVHSSRYGVDKSLTLGKVEGTVEAIREALQKLEKGCSVEDAKAVCEPKLLNQIVKWKSKLRVYLAPFLSGARYTSFGRHFTKLDKLKEIVDLVHCYVQDGDMIVDFCCGSNDFSWLMKEKLDEIGTRCSYKNYDLLQAKRDFSFEKRDWMTVRPRELPTGSQLFLLFFDLIMGLNPPFGTHASLANKFINKALEFKPKLLILIVPPETQRLDEKDPPYDLIWEDDVMLSGKSFYLPGSVDVNDNQLDDWNVTTPPLYLWSHPDWTAKHKAIAQLHGHLSRIQGQSNSEPQHEKLVSDYPADVEDLDGQIPMSIDDHPVENEVPEQLQEREARVLESRREGLPCDNDEKEVRESSSCGRNRDNGKKEVRENSGGSRGKNRPNKDSKKRRRGRGNHGRGSSETSPEIKEKGQSPLSEMFDKLPRLSPPIANRGTSLGDRSFEPLESPSHPEFGLYQAGYGETRPDDIARRRYGGLNREEPYPVATHRWPTGTSPSRGPDYVVGYSAERFPGYQRDTTNSLGHRSYISDFEQRYATESTVRSHVRLYGQPQQYPDTFGQRGGNLGGGDPGFSSSYSHLGSAAVPSYNPMHISATQRYAPRLDELNPTRINPLASMPPPPSIVGRNGVPDPPLAPQPGYRVNSMGFAPGPYPSFPQQNPRQNSSGWLND